MRFVQWKTETLVTNGIPASETRQAETLINFMNEHLLIQTVHEFTRANKSILDLVLVSNEELIHSIEVCPTKYSDHDELTINLLHKDLSKITNTQEETDKCNATKPPSLDDLYMLKANWTDIKEELQLVKWDDELAGDIEVQYKSLRTLLPVYVPNIHQ